MISRQYVAEIELKREEVESFDRYLLLVERERHPNLASKILGLVLRRLSSDWCERWGHRVLVVESFVDEMLQVNRCLHAARLAFWVPVKGRIGIERK